MSARVHVVRLTCLLVSRQLDQEGAADTSSAARDGSDRVKKQSKAKSSERGKGKGGELASARRREAEHVRGADGEGGRSEAAVLSSKVPVPVHEMLAGHAFHYATRITGMGAVLLNRFAYLETAYNHVVLFLFFADYNNFRLRGKLVS